MRGGLCRGTCGFYKTAAAAKTERAAAFARIAALPFPEQRYIAERHYGGFYPWVSGALA
jgi:hypothetical protein